MIYLALFAIFFKIGLFTIGGGLAALPLIQRELIALGWITQQEFIDMIAVSQSTPGPIGINMATFCGFRVASYGGALTATGGIVAPSLIIIMLIAKFLRDFSHLPLVQDALAGLRPAAIGLISAATWFILGTSVFLAENFPAGNWFQPKAFALFLVLGSAYHFHKAYPVVYIALGGLAGMALL